MPRTPEPTTIAAIVFEDNRLTKVDTLERVLKALSDGNLTCDTIEGRDRPDVLIVVPARHATRDAIMQTVRNAIGG